MQGHVVDDIEENGEFEEDNNPLTRQEAEALRKKLGAVSLQNFLLNVLVWQAVVGVTLSVSVWFVSGSAATVYSTLYGILCVVLPSALVVRVLLRRTSPDVPGRPGSMLTGLFVLEFAKILVTVSLLVAAPLVLASPDWIAIVVSFVVTLKVYWVVALVGLRQARHVQKIGINE